MTYIILPGRRNWVLNAKPVLLIHSNAADENTTFTDSGPTGHTITVTGDVQHDTAQKKFEGSSILFDGAGDFLSLADHANWDISGTNFTGALWVKHADHAGTETYIVQREDGSNKWTFDHIHGTGLSYWRAIGGEANFTVTGSEITDTDWHFVMFCKVGNDYGLYLGSSQVGYGSDAVTDTLAGVLSIGAIDQGGGGSAQPFAGHMDEIILVQGNPFGAVPVVGLTDTIVVPTKPYISWR